MVRWDEPRGEKKRERKKKGGREGGRVIDWVGLGPNSIYFFS
jgi:hypothetical protein